MHIHTHTYTHTYFIFFNAGIMSLEKEMLHPANVSSILEC